MSDDVVVNKELLSTLAITSLIKWWEEAGDMAPSYKCTVIPKVEALIELGIASEVCQNVLGRLRTN